MSLKKIENWLIPSERNSCRYSILNGGPKNGEWITLIKFENLISKESIDLELNSRECEEWNKKLFSWIKTWW